MTVQDIWLQNLRLLVDQEAGGATARDRRLVFVSGGGETIGLKSTDAARVERIRAAISQAISGR